MESDLILFFNEIRKGDVAQAGGKGANLGEMTHFHLAVPDGFVVTSSAYRLFLKRNGLDTFVQEKLQEAGTEEALIRCAEELRERILKGKLPEETAAEVRKAYASMGTQPRVAVRSSATAEDLADASFAGQQETYLNVRGEESVLAHILRCYASLWGNRAVIYRQNHGYDQTQVALAVVIQQMVESETAGVMFTADPVTGARDKIRINASYGLGESVVSGRVTADSWLLGRDGAVLQLQQGSKKTQILYGEDGGTVETEVPEADRSRPCLSEEMVAKLCREGLRVEEFYGMPMDIEWAIRDGRIYILQARAITTLRENEQADADEEARIAKYMEKCRISGMQRSNMMFMLEKIPYAYYPLDYELIEIIDDQKSVIFSEVGILMDGHPQIDDDGVSTLPPNGIKVGKKITHLPGMLGELSDLAHCEQILRDGMPQLEKELQQYINADYDSMDLTSCGTQLEKMRDYLRRLTYFRFKYALFPSVLAGRKLTGTAHKADRSLNSYDLYRDLDNETSLMSRDLEKLAAAFSTDSAVREAIAGGVSYARLREAYPQTAGELDAFLAAHGYKSDYNCYCLNARTFLENPDRILQLARPLIAKADSAKLEAAPKANEESFAVLMERIKAVLPAGKYERFARDTDIFRYMHVIREKSQMMWECEFFYMRKLFARISEHLFGTTDYMQDLAYLFSTEVVEICARGALLDSDREKIARRKASRPLAEKVWEAAKLRVFPEKGDVLKGISGSRGEVIGPVRIISGPEEFERFQKGDILVCKLTDPEWTPLFSLAAGVVADTGADLSHAAIVAREYGIPAVLGVGHATTSYRDGELIRVNGTKGEVTRVS